MELFRIRGDSLKTKTKLEKLRTHYCQLKDKHENRGKQSTKHNYQLNHKSENKISSQNTSLSLKTKTETGKKTQSTTLSLYRNENKNLDEGLSSKTKGSSFKERS